jgi:hypothetical protein
MVVCLTSKKLRSPLYQMKKILSSLAASMNTPLVSIPAIVVASIVPFAISSLFAPPAQAFGDYQSHEHPFGYIGSDYSQGNGDGICRKIFSQKGGYRTSGRIGLRSNSGGNADFDASANVVYAYDGAVINGANHVWYHKNNGECVANK